LGPLGASGAARTTQRPGLPDPVLPNENPAGGCPAAALSKLHAVRSCAPAAPDDCVLAATALSPAVAAPAGAVPEFPVSDP